MLKIVSKTWLTLPNDSSVFSKCKLKVDVGELKIGRYQNGVVTLNWIVPLAQSSKIQTAVQEYIQTNFVGKSNYEIVSDGTEQEGYKITQVYLSNENKSSVVFFKSIYYKAEKEPEKSSFTIIINGK